MCIRDRLHIEAVAEGGPAEAAGLQVGEDILAVDGTALTAENVRQAAEMIQGEEGTQVTLDVRDATGVERTVAVTRSRVTELPAEVTLLKDGTGLVTKMCIRDRCWACCRPICGGWGSFRWGGWIRIPRGCSF